MISLHKFLRAIGFSGIQNRKQLQALLNELIATADYKYYAAGSGNSLENWMYVEFCKDYAENIGIAVRGQFDEDDNYIYDYYFPYFKGSGISSREDISVERHAEKESYAGVCDDLKVGVSLIFYLQNMIDYLKIRNSDKLPMRDTSLTLSALSCHGKILMPIQKTQVDRKKIRQAYINRNHLIQAARKGDEEAIESLTLEDMDTYTTISRKIQKEDVFSLVDTCFMPYGVECDQYSILGEILDCSSVWNKITEEEILQMSVMCNDLIFDLCINKKDVVGEPEVGRRFKGEVWLQGYINFPQL